MNNTRTITNETLLKSVPFILLLFLRLYTESAYVTDSALVQNVIWVTGSAIASGFIVIGWLELPLFRVRIRRPGLIALMLIVIMFLIRMGASLIAGAVISVVDSVRILLHGLDFFDDGEADDAEMSSDQHNIC